MLALQPQSPLPAASQGLSLGRAGFTQQGGPVRRTVCPETLERICVSWNRVRCSYPSCSFCHICATCKRRGHKARDCKETPQDSQYKHPLRATPSPARRIAGVDLLKTDSWAAVNKTAQCWTIETELQFIPDMSLAIALVILT